MLIFSISYPDFIKFPYFVDLTQRGDRGWKEAQRQGEDGITLRNSVTSVQYQGNVGLDTRYVHAYPCLSHTPLEPNTRTRLVWNLKRVSNISARLVWIVRTNIDTRTSWYIHKLIPSQHCHVSSLELCPNELLFLEGEIEVEHMRVLLTK